MFQMDAHSQTTLEDPTPEAPKDTTEETPTTEEEETEVQQEEPLISLLCQTYSPRKP